MLEIMIFIGGAILGGSIVGVIYKRETDSDLESGVIRDSHGRTFVVDKLS